MTVPEVVGDGHAAGRDRHRIGVVSDVEWACHFVKALPPDPWMTTELTPLTLHPSDPATMST